MVRLETVILDAELAHLLKQPKNYDDIVEGVYVRVTPYKIYAVYGHKIFIFRRELKDIFSELREVVTQVKGQVSTSGST